MPTPFLGMDPCLEQSGIWNQVQIHLIVEIQRYLARLLRPKYVVAIGMRTFFTDLSPDEEKERYLEVRDRVTGEAITVIEILSPTNKTSHRRRYLRKRRKILGSETNLVEIDLLRAGSPMPMTGKTPPPTTASSSAGPGNALAHRRFSSTSSIRSRIRPSPCATGKMSRFCRLISYCATSTTQLVTI